MTEEQECQAYCIQVEQSFFRLRCLQPRRLTLGRDEGELIMSWHAAGIPLDLVLGAFNRRDLFSQRTGAPVRKVTYFERPVYEAFQATQGDIMAHWRRERMQP